MTTRRIYRTGPFDSRPPVDPGRIRSIAKSDALERPDSDPQTGAPIFLDDVASAVRDIETFTRLLLRAASYQALFAASAFCGSHSDEAIVLPGVDIDLDTLKIVSGGRDLDSALYTVFPIDRNDGVKIEPHADWDFAEGDVAVRFAAGSTGDSLPPNIVNLIGVQTRYLIHGEPDDYDLVADMFPHVEYIEVD